VKKKLLGGSVILLSAFSALLIVLVIVFLLTVLFLNGRHTLTLAFLLEAPKEGMTAGGIFPAIVGTALLVLIMSVAGVPVGTITAIYLSEYARQRSIFTRLIRFAVNTLAGVPAIVFGLFGLGFFVQFVGGGIDKALAASEFVGVSRIFSGQA